MIWAGEALVARLRRLLGRPAAILGRLGSINLGPSWAASFGAILAVLEAYCAVLEAIFDVRGPQGVGGFGVRSRELAVPAHCGSCVRKVQACVRGCRPPGRLLLAVGGWAFFFRGPAVPWQPGLGAPAAAVSCAGGGARGRGATISIFRNLSSYVRDIDDTGELHIDVYIHMCVRMYVWMHISPSTSASPLRLPPSLLPPSSSPPWQPQAFVVNHVRAVLGALNKRRPKKAF